MCSKIRLSLALLAVLFAVPSFSHAAVVEQPLAADSRIKTFIYNENEVFSLTLHYGYQANIEFGPQEEVQTISLGDRIAWQIIPAGRRLFIRPMEEKARTNMTIVTSKRAYQFDLNATGNSRDRNLVYVVRFFYPEDQPRMAMPVMAAAPSVTTSDMLSVAAPTPAMNFNYTFTGPDALAPTRTYDDGRSTFFQFRNMQGGMPQVATVAPDGTEMPIQAYIANGYLVVPTVGSQFALRSNDKVVLVYNESALSATAAR